MGVIPRMYHNTTARYNGYYYAKLKLHNLTADLETSAKIDYNKLLPLSLKEPADGSSVSADLDSAITKLALVLNLHPKSKWADDCYYLMGKAYYFKNDYKSALSTFQYVSSNFKESDKQNSKKKKPSGNTHKKSGGKKHYGSAAQLKEKNKPTKNKDSKEVVVLPWEKPKQGINFKFLSHKPARNNAIVWLIKSYVALEKYNEAAAIISVVNDDKDFPWKLRDDVELVHADLFIKQHRYQQAIEPLKNAIELTKNKKDKTRYIYILAQLYQLTNQNELAETTFKKVLHLKPDYEMEFYAKINLAKSIEDLPNANTAEVLALLEQITRDDKYTDFYDQVYYAIANIYLKQGDQVKGVSNLKMSIETSTTNTNQKGLSFLKLAEINFNGEIYRSAKMNYDSTAKFIDKSNSKISEIQSRKKILGKLIDQMDIIAIEDSLQLLAGMDPKELQKLLADIISKKEKEQAQIDSLKQQNLNENNPTVTNTPTPTTGGWYFYNTTAKSTGYNDFIKTWGNRKLEDDWRRSNRKSDMDAGNDIDSDGDTTSVSKNPSYNGIPGIDDLMKNIPLTATAIQASNNRIMHAYFEMGNIYQNDLNNLQKAAESFEKMLELFPNNELAPQVYYSLYLIFGELSNTVKKENYRKLILTDYPLSLYAKILSDPNYLKSLSEKDNEVNVYYASTFNFYTQKNYSEVIKRIQTADSIYKSNPIQIKFDFLKSMTVGNTQNHEVFKKSLTDFVFKYKNGEEVDQANAILALLNIDSSKTISLKTDSVKTPQATFLFKPENPQFVVILFSDFGNQVKTVVDSISNYNTKFHSLDNYKVNPLLFDANRQMIVVKQMKNAEDAMKYFKEILNHESFYEKLGDTTYDIFVIDDKNWQLFYKEKNIEKYIQFFQQYYK